MLRNPIFLWLGRDPLSPPLDPHMFMYLSICIHPFIRNCVWKLKFKVHPWSKHTRKYSYDTKLTTMNEMMQHYWLTLYLRVAFTLCMLSHDDIIQRALEYAGHRKYSWIRAWYYHKANSVGCTCSSLPTSVRGKKSKSQFLWRCSLTILYREVVSFHANQWKGGFQRGGGAGSPYAPPPWKSPKIGFLSILVRFPLKSQSYQVSIPCWVINQRNAI